MGADQHEDVKPDDGHAALRRRHVADFEAMLPEYLDRIDWTADRVAANVGVRCERCWRSRWRDRHGTASAWLASTPADSRRRTLRVCP
jgi:hypothetical protein